MLAYPSSGCERSRFNPRPPPKRGANLQAVCGDSRDLVSIHAPLRREERRLPEKMLTFLLQFQSTPPSEERSDPLKQWTDQTALWFQSTPPSEERSDHPTHRVEPLG